MCFDCTGGLMFSQACSKIRRDRLGETKRNLGTRLGEHQAATRRGETEKSALAEHAWAKQRQHGVTQQY